MDNKIIHMTYKNEIPSFVIDRWKYLNKDYEVEISLDNDCIYCLRNNFNEDVVDIFKNIKKGMYKADLWRLCKLYMEGNTYTDVDLVPNVSLDKFNNHTFYTCLADGNKSIFQAFMKIKNKRNPLILLFLISFLLRKPYTYANGPTYDMYNCLCYNLNLTNIKHDTPYILNNIKIPIKVGSSDTNTKIVNLHYFPNINCNIEIDSNRDLYDDLFDCFINDNKLYVTRIDKECGWSQDLKLKIIIEEKVLIYLFKESIPHGENMVAAHVKCCNNIIFSSRDPIYHYNKGWKI